MAAPAPRTVFLSVRGPISSDDVTGLCEHVCALLADQRAEVVLCDVSGIEPGVGTVDALARLLLAAQRLGRQVRLRNVSDTLLELVVFMGLTEVLLE
jgi:ABC-type transporter Mla MlaB component